MLPASSDQCQSLPECTAPAVSPGETENETEGDGTWRRATRGAGFFPADHTQTKFQMALIPEI